MSNYNKPFTSYIAFVKGLRPEHRQFAKELTDRGFPCVISNDVNNGREYPNCDKEQAMLVSNNRFCAVNDENTKWFILFMDEACDISWVELGLAYASNVEHICIIGSSLKNTYCCASNITHYSCWDNFIARHFLG